MIKYWLTSDYYISIYSTFKNLPDDWDRFNPNNQFLSADYLSVLEESSPSNMQCYFVGIYDKQNNLVGKTLCQHINLKVIQPFQSANRWLDFIKYQIIRLFASNILIIGNNMLTGQPAFLFNSTFIDKATGISLLPLINLRLKQHYQKNKINIHISIIKDIEQSDYHFFNSAAYKGYTSSIFQPNMVFNINKEWQSFADYKQALNTKYRTQLNRARKKEINVIKKPFSEYDILIHYTAIDDLYKQVQKNATFNTFTLPANHFSKLKLKMKNDFHFYGYFLDNKLVGFNTIIGNGNNFQTYFLGYDNEVQKDTKLYINMLYDMIDFSIDSKVETLSFGRTAMEIKSSVGATPTNLYVFIRHHLYLLNLILFYLMPLFTPKVNWQNRQPFK